MIRPLRQWHRMMACMLGVVLPLAFAAGIAGRKPVPASPGIPSSIAGSANNPGNVVWTKPDIWPGHEIATTVRRDVAGVVTVELMFRDLTKPDVLVYWVGGKSTTVESLPDSARLLGVLSNGRSLPFLADALYETGRLVLYSLADHEIVAMSTPISLQPFNASTL
jgi:hypothetical protein